MDDPTKASLGMVAAKLRFHVESLLQTNSVNQNQNQNEVPERFFGTPVPATATAGVRLPTLETDFLQREIVELKERLEKVGVTLRSKEQQFKLLNDTVQKERAAAEVARRELLQNTTDSKSNERYIKCVQGEYDVFRSVAAKNTETMKEYKTESAKLSEEINELTTVLNKQAHEIKTKDIENSTLRAKVLSLQNEVITQRALATTATSKSTQATLLLEHMQEKSQRLEQRMTTLCEQLQQERSLNASHRAATAEAELVALQASQGILTAGNVHAELIARLGERDREIASLRKAVEDQSVAPSKAKGSAVTNTTTHAVVNVNEAGSPCPNANATVPPPVTAPTVTAPAAAAAAAAMEPSTTTAGSAGSTTITTSASLSIPTTETKTNAPLYAPTHPTMSMLPPPPAPTATATTTAPTATAAAATSGQHVTSKRARDDDDDHLHHRMLPNEAMTMSGPRAKHAHAMSTGKADHRGGNVR